MSEYECVLSCDEMETQDGVYTAIRFVAGFCPCEPTIVTALACAISDYLRLAPADIRGQVADRVVEMIRNDVRQSLQ